MSAQAMAATVPEVLFGMGIPVHIVFSPDPKVLWMRLLSVVTNIDLLASLDR
jgi:hypothetical protein